MSSDSPLSARARASRSNGARSRGPRTAAGKARSSRNALKHGLCAQTILVLPDEDAAAFQALEAALLAELAPEGALQGVLAQRIVSAAWRLARADRTEAEVLAFRRGRDGDLGLALVRDGNGTRSVDTLLRYRGAALAELLRTLRTLQTLQAEARAGTDLSAPHVRKRRLLRRRNEPSKSTGSTDCLRSPRPNPPPRRPDPQPSHDLSSRLRTGTARTDRHPPRPRNRAEKTRPIRALPHGRPIERLRAPRITSSPAPSRRCSLRHLRERNKHEKPRRSNLLAGDRPIDQRPDDACAPTLP